MTKRKSRITKKATKKATRKNNINQVINIIVDGSKSKSKSRKATRMPVPQMIPQPQGFRSANPDASLLGELATIRTSLKEQQSKVGQLDDIKRDVARAYVDLTGDGIDQKEEKDFKKFLANLEKAGREGFTPASTPAKPRVKLETPGFSRKLLIPEAIQAPPKETPIRPNQNFRVQDLVKLAKRYSVNIPQDLQALIDADQIGGKKQAGLQKKLSAFINMQLDEQDAKKFQEEEDTSSLLFKRGGSLDDSFLREVDQQQRRLEEMMAGGGGGRTAPAPDEARLTGGLFDGDGY